MKKLGLLSIMFFLILSACRKDEITQGETTTTIPTPTILEKFEPTVENISGSLIGFVVDENDVPVSAASIKLGNNTTTTDDYGHFFFENVTMNSRGALVTIDKDGYFPGSRRFFPKANAGNRVKIQLLEKSFDQSFSANEGGMITLPNGASIEFDANSIKTEDGSAFSGVVQVATKWMDPSSLATMDQMPGNLQGVNVQSEEVALATFGMMAVELEDENGATLNIADDATATLSMPVPASLLTNAPAEIPLWSYNEEYGLWVEESTATLQNGKYVGTVNHFSFWNCDAPYPLVEFSATIVDEDGNPVTNTLVTMESPDLWRTGQGYTDGNGVVSGLLPADESLVLKVFNICGDEIYSGDIGPFGDNTDLGTITVSNPLVNSTIISGTLECDGAPVANGVVIAASEGQTVYHYVTGGSFSFAMTTCSETAPVNVTGVDIDMGTQSDAATAMSGIINDLGTLQACELTFTNYFRISVDGDEAVYLDPTIEADSSGFTAIQHFTNTQDAGIYIGFYGSTVGDYSGENDHFIEVIFDSNKGWEFGGNFDSFIITEYGPVGGTVDGNFSGDFNGQQVVGDFSIIRQ